MDQKILALKLFQPFAHYRNPFTMDHPFTFPLPPRSTVVGMLQNLIEDPYGINHEKEWDDLEVYILGRNISKFRHAVNLYKADAYTFDIIQKKFPVAMKSNPKYLNENKGFDSYEELFGVYLLILLRGNDKILDQIKQKAGRKVVSLGRAEDIVFFQKVSLISTSNLIETKSKFALIDNYGFYVLARGIDLEKFSNTLPMVGAALSSKFKIDGRLVRSRQEILVNRNKVEREVILWRNNGEKKVYYVPPYSELRNCPSIKKLTINSEDKEESYYLVDEGWLDGQP
ncbi:MAG: CRISPR-associated protein Cas5 [Candidatus Anstonellales archaeon]